MDAEKIRLRENRLRQKHWRRFGTYLSERQWGTVREDYSDNGDAWDYFTYDEARSRPYRWGEDGIGGLCDNHGRLCFAFSFWNGKDPHLKERLFGLSNPQGNHGEDIKELFFYLDNTPTCSYAQYLYKYPQGAFPYDQLRKENQKRSQKEPEFELIDTGIFDEGRYFDLFIEYAKINPHDIGIRLRIVNRGPEDAELLVIPTLWFRNTWSWSDEGERPRIQEFVADLPEVGRFKLYFPPSEQVVYTENEIGKKEAFHKAFVENDHSALNNANEGSKCGYVYHLKVKKGEEVALYGRLSDKLELSDPLGTLEEIFRQRKSEADDFYASIQCPTLNEEHRALQRQAFAGMLWNKQYYHYIVEKWLEGDPKMPAPPEGHKKVRNFDWLHLYNDDVLSVPDKWEYSAFFSWDSAFHALPLALIDLEFAKRQMMLLTREWYMHPSGQLPAYEWNFDDVNPPVHAWATHRVYKIEQKILGEPDVAFLESIFHKLLMNFTWWVNRKDSDGKNIFQGGFLGLDNISVFNRSEHLPPGCSLYQSDATSWMGMYCLDMLKIALELAELNAAYEDMASKFYEHFLYIADAINYTEEGMAPIWDEEDGFYYDILIHPDKKTEHIKVRSLVGLIPLLAVTTLKKETLEKARGFSRRMEWFIENRKDLCSKVACMKTPGVEGRRILALVTHERLVRVLKIMLDEEEFLSPYGIRSISKYHEKNPYRMQLDGHHYSVDYEPAESTLKLFGGNSNWRGPIWFPINMLLIESLQRYHHYLGDDFKVECPTGSGNYLTLWEVAAEISKRLLKIFEPDEKGRRPLYANRNLFQTDPHFRPYIHFHEYFNGDTGEGLGASHQTGWTGLIAKLVQQLGDYHHL